MTRLRSPIRASPSRSLYLTHICTQKGITMRVGDSEILYVDYAESIRAILVSQAQPVVSKRGLAAH